MTRRIIYIIVGSLVILGLILGLWFWFFGHGTSNPQTTNLFGTGGDKTGTSDAGTGTSGNGQAPIGSTAGTGVSGSSGSQIDSGGVNNQTPIIGIGDLDNQGSNSDIPYVGLADNTVDLSPDIVWNSSYNPTSGNLLFNPTATNGVVSGTISGQPSISSITGADGSTISLGTSLGVLIGGCISQYGINLLATKAGSFLNSLLSLDAIKVQVSAQSTNAAVGTNSITDCLVRTLGKLAVQKITDSTVSWINSGFDGKPAFVQDFNKFFNDVADNAAGEFLQSSNFAFLCSPFQLQVKIAVAQSYARRNNAASCTLTQAVGNVENFLNGNFSEGGWGGLISFTTEPANNPFGAYMALQAEFDNSVTGAQELANRQISPGGFLAQTKCDENRQNCKITTPGQTIEDSLAATFGENMRQLGVGDSITQILGALQNALITKVLSKGLSNYSAGTGSNADTGAETQANALMTELGAGVSSAQQYGAVMQGSINDAQVTQGSLVDLANCWTAATSTPGLTAGQIDTANAGAKAATDKVYELQTSIDAYNANIERANTSITTLQMLQTNLLTATVASDVSAVQGNFNSIKASGTPHIYTSADVVTAQQDRTTAQSNLANINADTSAKLQQCNALGQ